MWLPSKPQASKAYVSINFIFVNGTPEYLWSSLELGIVRNTQKQTRKAIQEMPPNLKNSFILKILCSKQSKKNNKKPCSLTIVNEFPD